MDTIKPNTNKVAQTAKTSQPQPGDIKNILLKENYVTAEDIKKAEDFAKVNKTSIEEYLLSQGLITRDLLGQALAESHNTSYADLNGNPPNREQVLKIPQDLASAYHLVLYKEDESSVILATDDPQKSQGVLAQLKTLFPDKKISFVYSHPEDIENGFVHYRKPLETRFSQILTTQARVAPEIIEEIIKDALTFHASDVHFEPQEEEVIIRFRVDGILHEAGKIQKEFYENILNRIKIKSRMRIDEHFSAQDGAIRFPQADGFVDMRVSIVPTLDGEKIAIRILAEYVKGFTVSDLGLSEKDQVVIQNAAKKPFGMILVTGPTGSGKTTTLYALLKTLNHPDINITTIEDPVEYKVLGLNQIQVNLQTNLTFAQGLRSILRQDPDVVLVGEIRDLETAEIAVNAALTGHLLFTTFHANDASTAIPRLLDMGVEPFLMASTLELIIAQRLVRRICESCRFSQNLKKEDVEKLLPNAKIYFPDSSITLYKGKGCKACGNTGYKGRTAIFEYIEITPQMEELILKNPPNEEVRKLASEQGAHSLFEDGMDKVKNGITTLEELMRVATPPQQ